MEMGITEAVSLIGALLGLVGTLVGCIISLIKAVKAKNAEKVKSALNDAAMAAAVFAEKIQGLNGEAKKQIALSRINREMTDKRMKYETEMAEEMLESVVSMSKEVNVREKFQLQKENEWYENI